MRAYAGACAFLEADRKGAPGCLVLDLQLPGLSGLELQRELADRGIPIPIIFISAHANVPLTVQAMKAGAADFLIKPFRDQDYWRPSARRWTATGPAGWLGKNWRSSAGASIGSHHASGR